MVNVLIKASRAGSEFPLARSAFSLWLGQKQELIAWRGAVACMRIHEEHRSSGVTRPDRVPRPDLREHALGELHALVEFGDFVRQLLHRFG